MKHKVTMWEQGRTEVCDYPGQDNNLAPLRNNIPEIFVNIHLLGAGKTYFLSAFTFRHLLKEWLS
jgi:hypothetical protein